MSDIAIESNGEMWCFGEMFGDLTNIQMAKHDAAMAAIQNTR